MKQGWSIAIFCAAWICVAGCGSEKAAGPPTGPPSSACKGAAITGTLQDSLTGQAPSQGWAMFEVGTNLQGTGLYNFAPNQQVATNAQGKFEICVPAITAPAALVAIGLDSANHAYPAFVTSVSAAIDLGSIAVGGCRVTCGLEGQQQSAPPATITGLVTSQPGTATGVVVPQYAVSALDGSANVWNLAMPTLNPSQSFTFTTASTSCPSGIVACSAYTFVLPSEKPVTLVKGASSQEAGAPLYAIGASVASGSSCLPPSITTISQQNGAPLTGDPGALLSATTILFNDCQ